MPIALLKSYMAMLPRLSAEQQLADAQTAMVAGSARIELAEARRWSDDQRRVADGDDNRRRVRQTATPETLAVMGIGVVIEPAHV